MVNEVDGVPQELIDAFSSRDAEIEQLLEKKIDEYETSTGKQAGWRMKAELHKEAWLATRKAKPEIQPSLKAKRDHWYQKLGEVAPGIQIDRMLKDVNSRKTSLMHVDAECEDDIANCCSASSPTSPSSPETRTNIWTVRPAWRWRTRPTRTPYGNAPMCAPKPNGSCAECASTRRNASSSPTRSRQGTQPMRQTHTRPVPGAERCVGQSEHRHPARQSVFEDADLDKYTTVDVLQAERYMIESLDKTVQLGYAPGEGNQWLDQWNKQMNAQGGYPLASDQQKAAAYVLENPRLVSSIIGPAGTGKTTTMKAVAQAWQARYGSGSVIGLATSKKAVGELKGSIGCESMTIAKLLTINNPERIMAAIQREGMLQQRLRNASNPLERLFARIHIAAQRVMDTSDTISRTS